MIMAPLETRECFCGCGNKFRTLPSSKQKYSCISCEEFHNNTAKSYWRNLSTTSEAKIKLRNMISGSMRGLHYERPQNYEEIRKIVGL